MRFLQVFAASAALGLFVGVTEIATAQARGKATTGAMPPISKPAMPSAEPVSYRESIEPFLKANCGSCHSADKHFSGLVVETPESLFKGGAKFAGKAVVPGKASESALVAYLRGKNQPRMPLNGQPVAEAQIRQIDTWINQGAKIDTLKLGWPYTPPVTNPLPKVKNTAWVRNPIDAFVLAKLEEKGLKPSPPAGKSMLLRRVYADLIGEPPTPQEADAFLNDPAPDAYEKLVDRLLADPRYGERWARHWLDLVRYAETHGFENDGIRPRAWRYRDYVIRAFNDDKPYDRFLKEQIAGDELYPNDPDAFIATGFARLAAWDELSREPDQRWQDYLNDVTDTTGSVMLGLTVGCARCHNHKYDRITQSDYYRLQAFYAPTRWADTRLPDDSNGKMAEARKQLLALRIQHQQIHDKYRALALAAKQKQAKPGQKVEVNDQDIDRLLTPKEREERDYRNGEIRRLDSLTAPYEPLAETITDNGRSAPVSHLLLRGNLRTPGPEVKPGFIAALIGGEEKPADCTPPANSNTTGRRTALAGWIGSRNNPLTARVLVNRLWQHHFGRGIVATPSDFGRNGDKPTHPELLDWLACAFTAESIPAGKQEQRIPGKESAPTAYSLLPTAYPCGWSLKKMHRLMLLSATYQQSTKLNPTASQADPNNALFWRMNRIRLEGEPLRDSILAVSGRLNPAMGGPGIYPKVSDEVLSTGSTHKWGSSSEADGLRRTIYVFQRRSLVLPIVEVFDGADMTNTCPRRANTTIAPQALALFNSDFTRTESRYFAARVIKEAGDNRDAQIERVYKIALARRPSDVQRVLAKTYLDKQTQLHLKAKSDAANDPNAQKTAAQSALADFCHVLINTNEFLYLD